MNDNIISTSGKTFQKFISNLTRQLIKPKDKFIRINITGLKEPSDKQKKA